MTLQTSNALLIIRSFTKYIIEIENETALLEQMNHKPQLDLNSPAPASTLEQDQEADILNQMSDLNIKKQSAEFSTGSPNASPRRIYNSNRRFYRQNINSQKQAQSQDEDTRENSIEIENDSDSDSIPSSPSANKTGDILYQLIRNIFQICIDVPVR